MPSDRKNDLDEATKSLAEGVKSGLIGKPEVTGGNAAVPSGEAVRNFAMDALRRVESGYDRTDRTKCKTRRDWRQDGSPWIKRIEALRPKFDNAIKRRVSDINRPVGEVTLNSDGVQDVKIVDDIGATFGMVPTSEVEARVRLLCRHKYWGVRLLEAMHFCPKDRPESERLMDVVKICDESIREFGPWQTGGRKVAP